MNYAGDIKSHFNDLLNRSEYYCVPDDLIYRPKYRPYPTSVAHTTE